MESWVLLIFLQPQSCLLQVDIILDCVGFLVLSNFWDCRWWSRANLRRDWTCCSVSLWWCIHEVLPITWMVTLLEIMRRSHCSIVIRRIVVRHVVATGGIGAWGWWIWGRSWKRNHMCSWVSCRRRNGPRGLLYAWIVLYSAITPAALSTPHLPFFLSKPSLSTTTQLCGRGLEIGGFRKKLLPTSLVSMYFPARMFQ